ncbi:MAG: hypothetical protein VX642_10635 [Bdellovibrionota bacterium]|nr:hypothetical protein [Bdellovibrionota bacterium]
MKQVLFPMTPQFEAYLDFNNEKFTSSAWMKQEELATLERRRTNLRQTFRFIRRKFGRRRIIESMH